MYLVDLYSGMTPGGADEEWKAKTIKVAVVFLRSPTDFEAWHFSLRRLVKALGMGDALMYTVPENQIPAMKAHFDETVKKTEKDVRVKREAAEQKVAEGTPVAPDISFMKIDLTSQAPLASEPRSDKDAMIMRSMGITPAMDEFFSATVIFQNFRTDKKETDKENFYRQEIWTWLESSISQGPYKYLARSLLPPFDIRALYTSIVNMANKATWISHALEVKKIFQISMAGHDIFQYHADIFQQMRVIQNQGVALGMDTSLPSWILHALLLLAAHESPPLQKDCIGFQHGRKNASQLSL